MKHLLKIIPLASLLSLTASLALHPRASATPSVAVVSYELPECTQTDAPGSGLAGVHTPVAEGSCTALTPTYSFQTFLNNPCPEDTTAEVTVYSTKGCVGVGITETGLGPVSADCIEDPFVGLSALFRCVES